MPVLPHPTKEKTWVINYEISVGGNKQFHKAEFEGTLKDALLQERALHKSVKG